MDHIQHPIDAVPKLMKVPYVCQNDYHNLDHPQLFAEYPTRQGYHSPSSLLELHTDAPSSFVSLLQNWLYFGLLAEFLGTKPSNDDFVRESSVSEHPPMKTIHTGELPRLLDEWKSRILSLNTKDREELLVKIYKCISYATDWAEQLDSHIYYDDDLHQAPLIIFSIKVLIEAMIMAAFDYDTHFKPVQAKTRVTSQLKKYAYSFRRSMAVSNATILPVADISRHFDHRLNDIQWTESHLRLPKASSYIQRCMIRAGWCPHYLSHICKTYSSSALYYLSTLQCKSTLSRYHTACDEKKCIANNVNEAAYETTHVEEGCPCSLLVVSEKELIDMIRGGETPLVSLEKDPSGLYSLKLTAATSRFSSSFRYYVAISHVWSDGRGNPHTNGLYLCQLEKICAYIEKISQPTGSAIFARKPWVFWMDTLCIPLSDSEDAKAMRKKAIGHMDVVYANAEKVLVLDRQLEQTTHLGLNTQEVFARITFSSWMTRCWTLQEAALAWHLSIQFSDGNLDMGNSLEEHSKSLRIDNIDINWDTRRRLCPFDNKISVDGPGLETVLYPTNSLENFVRTWNALAYRSTSKHKDIYAIIAVLNGFNAASLLALNTENSQLRAILRRQKLLPLSFLTDVFFTRQSNENNRWAPLRFDGTKVSSENGFLEIADEGLLVHAKHELQGLLIPNDMPQYQQFCLVEETSQKRWYIRLNYAEETSSQNDSSCIFIIPPPNPETLPGSKQPQKGFRISSYKISEQTIYGKFDYPIEISQNITPKQENWPLITTKPTPPKYNLILNCGKSNHPNISPPNIKTNITTKTETTNWPELKHHDEFDRYTPKYSRGMTLLAAGLGALGGVKVINTKADLIPTRYRIYDSFGNISTHPDFYSRDFGSGRVGRRRFQVDSG